MSYISYLHTIYQFITHIIHPYILKYRANMKAIARINNSNDEFKKKKKKKKK